MVFTICRVLKQFHIEAFPESTFSVALKKVFAVAAESVSPC